MLDTNSALRENLRTRMTLLLFIVAILICIGGVRQWLVWRDLNDLNRHNEAVNEELQRRQRRFSEIGDPTGKTLQQIIETAGLPQSYSNVGGNLLVQWIHPGTHLSLLFEYRGPKPEGTSPVNVSQHEADFFCLRITHQYAAGM